MYKVGDTVIIVDVSTFAPGIKIGDKVKAQVVKMNDGEGNVLLSNKKLMVKQIKEELDKKKGQ